MNALELIADPTRRRIVELLAEQPLSAGEIAHEFDIARPGVSRHLRRLREGGLVSVSRDGQRQIYRLEAEPLAELDEWLAPIRSFWNNRLDALETELLRGSRPNHNARHNEIHPVNQPVNQSVNKEPQRA